MMGATVNRFGAAEYLIWQGRPRWTALARDVLHVRLVALYLAVVWIWVAAANRGSGLSPMDTLAAGAPLAMMSAVVVGAWLALAWGLARTTRYTLTNERCIMHFGLALAATLSLPLHHVASVAIAARADGTGDLPIQIKPGHLKAGKRLGYIKLWPHVRPWRISDPAPMLRCVPDAARVGLLLSQAVEARSAGRRYSPAPAGRAGMVQPGTGAPAHG